jgi:hypothetical protein
VAQVKETHRNLITQGKHAEAREFLAQNTKQP